VTFKKKNFITHQLVQYNQAMSSNLSSADHQPDRELSKKTERVWEYATDLVVPRQAHR
jgi:hypothetical protein